MSISLPMKAVGKAESLFARGSDLVEKFREFNAPSTTAQQIGLSWSAADMLQLYNTLQHFIGAWSFPCRQPIPLIPLLFLWPLFFGLCFTTSAQTKNQYVNCSGKTPGRVDAGHLSAIPKASKGELNAQLVSDCFNLFCVNVMHCALEPNQRWQAREVFQESKKLSTGSSIPKAAGGFFTYRHILLFGFGSFRRARRRGVLNWCISLKWYWHSWGGACESLEEFPEALRTGLKK